MTTTIQTDLELELDEILNFHQISTDDDENESDESLKLVELDEIQENIIEESLIEEQVAKKQVKKAKSTKMQAKTQKTSDLSDDSGANDENTQINQKPQIIENRYVKNYNNSKKSEVLIERIASVGDDPFSYLVLDKNDLSLPADELRKEQENFLNLINTQPHRANGGDSVQKKVAEKIVILFTMFARENRWNEVMRRTFKVLLRDGYIVGGIQGNLAKELLAKPYSKGTTLAQSGQMMQMLPLLKIATKQGNKLVLNENSTIIEKIKKDYLSTLDL